MSNSQIQEAAQSFEKGFSSDSADQRKKYFEEALDYMKSNSQQFDSRSEIKALSNTLASDGFLPQVAFSGLDTDMDVQSTSAADFSDNYERHLQAATADTLLNAFSEDDWQAISGGDGDLSEDELNAILSDDNYTYGDGKALTDQQRMGLLMLKQTYEAFDNNSMWSDCDYQDIKDIYNERQKEVDEIHQVRQAQDDKAFDKMDELATVRKEEGFYQSARRMMGPDADEAKVKELTARLKSDWMERTGKGYESLSPGEELLTPEYLAELRQDYPELDERCEELAQAA